MLSLLLCPAKRLITVLLFFLESVVPVNGGLTDPEMERERGLERKSQEDEKRGREMEEIDISRNNKS